MLKEFVYSAILIGGGALYSQSNNNSLIPQIKEIIQANPCVKKQILPYAINDDQNEKSGIDKSVDVHIIENSSSTASKLFGGEKKGICYNGKIIIFAPNCDSYLKNYCSAIKDGSNKFSKLQYRKDAYPKLEEVIDDAILHESSRIFFKKNYSNALSIKKSTNKKYAQENALKDRVAEEEFCILAVISQGRAPYLELYNVFSGIKKEFDDVQKNRYVYAKKNALLKKSTTLDIETVAGHNVLLDLDKKIGSSMHNANVVYNFGSAWPKTSVLQTAAEEILLEKHPELKNSPVIIE